VGLRFACPTLQNINVEGKLSMPGEANTKRITTGFNVALFMFSAIMGILLFLASGKANNVSVEGVILSTIVDSVRFVAMLLISAYFLKEFWERLISNLFPVRAITYAEAIAIGLMFGILF
jgi:hypothetical protein